MKNRLKQKNNRKASIRKRVRKNILGSKSRPRLSVFKSLKHIYVQAIDDENGTTLVAASSTEKEGRVIEKNADRAKYVGENVAQRLIEKGIESVIFDRGASPYHGNVEILATSAREKGLKF